jgi:radical S-adenosyl methionine domain-containing protein 2
MKYKINLHLLEACNYRCRHCFAHFNSTNTLATEEWRKIIDNCIDSKMINEFNLAGGEPFLYKGLTDLIDYIDSKNYKTSIITNGSLITKEWIKRNAKKLDTIGFSIDSMSQQTLFAIGRHTCTGKILTEEELESICYDIKECNPKCKIKINTVVSQLNKDENLSKLITKLPIARWKIIKMRKFSNSTHNNFELYLTDEAYNRFVKKNLGKRIESFNDELSLVYKLGNTDVVLERQTQSAYLMIDANGYLVDNSENDNYVPVCNCLTESFINGFKRLNFNSEYYNSRYNEEV